VLLSSVTSLAAQGRGELGHLRFLIDISHGQCPVRRGRENFGHRLLADVGAADEPFVSLKVVGVSRRRRVAGFLSGSGC
jgi:hypothetical protein